jgi:hypothetical protein
MMKIRILILGLILTLASIAIAQTPIISVKSLMTANEFKAAGLNKLTPEELRSLDQWFARVITTVAQLTGSSSVGSTTTMPGTYPIEAAVNDETFIINGEVFKAQTYCFNVNRGDRVKFIEGSAFGACASAKFLNMRTGDICSVWCE